MGIRGAITAAKLNVSPVRRGYWGRKGNLPHTVPCKVTGKCGSVRVRLIPAPRGTGLVSSPAGKKLMHMAGIEDCYTSTRGHSRTMGNLIKAMFYALKATYTYLSPELWKEEILLPQPYQNTLTFWLRNRLHKYVCVMIIYTTKNVQAQADLSFTHYVKASLSIFFFSKRKKKTDTLVVLEQGRKHGACGVA